MRIELNYLKSFVLAKTTLQIFYPLDWIFPTDSDQLNRFSLSKQIFGLKIRILSFQG